MQADYNRLERIVTNLLSNAVKYSTPGTPVRVHATLREQEVEIAVSDEGPGIPPGDLPHLFDRFFRAKSVEKDGRHGIGIVYHQNPGRSPWRTDPRGE